SELSDLVIHIVAAHIEDLPSHPFSAFLNPLDKSLHHIVNVDERPPLIAAAHNVYDALPPSPQSHDVDREVKPHAGGKAEERGIAKNDGLKILISKSSQ